MPHAWALAYAEGVAFAALAIDLSHTLVAPSAYPVVLQYPFVSHHDRFLDHL